MSQAASMQFPTSPYVKYFHLVHKDSFRLTEPVFEKYMKNIKHIEDEGRQMQPLLEGKEWMSFWW